MRKIEASNSSAWRAMEKLSHHQIVGNLLGYEPFVAAISCPGRGGDGQFHPQPLDKDEMPVVILTCPKGHPIRRLTVEVDRFANITVTSPGGGDGQWALDLAAPAGTETLPLDQVTMLGQPNWPASSKEMWCCYHDDCETAIEWGTAYCEAHRDEPMPDVPEYVWQERLTVTCPQPKCTYRGVHRRDSLLIDYAIAVATHRQRMRLQS